MSIKKIATELYELVEQKQEAYGNAFERTSEMMAILYPEGIGVDQLHDAALLVRVLDKICRIAHDNDAMGESPWRDIAGYSLLALEHQEKQQKINLLNQLKGVKK